MTIRTFNLGHRDQLSWPMDQTELDNLGETLLVSPRVGNAHGYSPPDLATYNEQVADVKALRDEIKADRWPMAFLIKYLGTDDLSPILAKYLMLSKTTPKKCADTVRMDHPFDIWDEVVEKYIADEGIAPLAAYAHQGDAFVEKVMLRANVHSAIATALNKAFDVKYSFGICRPIEYYDPSLQRFATPNHPESPAGHGSFCGGCSKSFDTYMDATQQQKDDVAFATKQFAMFRSFSAMHIPYSNLLGWQIGYEA